MDGAVVGDAAAGHGGAVQRQCHAAVDGQLVVAELVVLDAAVGGDMHRAGIGDGAAGQRHPGQGQGLAAAADIDGAVVGDGTAGHRGAVQRQCHAAVDGQLVVAELVVLDAAVGGDVDRAGIGDRAAGQRHPVQGQGLAAAADIDGAVVGDGAAGHGGG